MFVIIPSLADKQFVMQLIHDPQPSPSSAPSKYAGEVSSPLMTNLVETMIIFLKDPI